MITYNSENALLFMIPPQDGCTIPTLKEVVLSSLGGYGTGLSVFGTHNYGKNGEKYPGVFVKTSTNSFGILLGDEFQPQIYRGQNNDYPSFSSSYDRLTTEVERVIAGIKREEFRQFFMQTPYYKRCREFSVLDCNYDFDFEAIFQHYGFKSSYVDITKNLLVALFFAYTYYSKEDEKYHPIENFNDYAPYLYVSNISAINNGESVSSISLQMVNRPINQMAMALKTDGTDLKECFKKYELPKDPYIALDIFEKFNHGLALFPEEPISETVNSILKSNELNREITEKLCNDKSLINELEKQNYILSDIKWPVTEETRCRINDEINRFLIPFLTRMAYRRVSQMA